MINEKIFSISISILILFNIVLLRTIIKSFIFPATLLSIFGFLYTFIPLIFVFTAPINVFSIFYIYLFILIFTISSLPFNWEKAFEKNKLKTRLMPNYFNNQYMLIIFYLLTVFIFFLILFNVFLQGINPLNFIFDFYHTSNKYLSMRYSGEIKTNFTTPIINILTYASVVIGSLIFMSSEKKKYSILILTFLPTVILTLITVSKGVMLFSLFLFFGSTLIVNIYKNNFILVTKQSIRIFIILIVTLFILFIVTFISKGMFLNSNNSLDTILFLFRSYSCAHLYAFSDWFSFYFFNNSIQVYTDGDKPIGFYTFLGLYQIFSKDAIIPLGLYTEYYSYNNLMTSNIYTIFRGLIIDFGLVGSFIFALLSGFLLHLNFYLLLTRPRALFAIIIFIYMFVSFYQSFIVSSFMWKSVYPDILFIYTILWINNYLQGKK